jgi:heptosyltransferase-1
VKILIVKLSAIGDVIHTLPALNALRAHYPHAHITWLVEEAAADLVVGHRALDRVIVSRRKFVGPTASGPPIAGRRGRRSDVFQGPSRHPLRYGHRFSRPAEKRYHGLVGQGRRKIGFDKGMQHQEHSYLFLNERVPPVDMEVHALTRGLMLLNAIGIPTPTVDYDVPCYQGGHQSGPNVIESSGD